MEMEAAQRRLSARRGGRRSSETSGRRLRPSSVLGKRKNESGGGSRVRAGSGCYLKRPRHQGGAPTTPFVGDGCGLATEPARGEREVGGGTDRWGQVSVAGHGGAVAWRGCWAERLLG